MRASSISNCYHLSKLAHDIDLDEMFPYYGLKTSVQSVDISLAPDRFNLIIHPKSKGSAREWGLQHFNLLIQSLPPQEFRIFISGLQEEGDLIRRETPELFEHEHVTDLTGKLSLGKMISFIQQADGLLACSTGVLHIASALGKYALGLYAPMRPIHPGRWKPVGPHASYLVLNKNCEACRKSQDCECIRSITVAQVKARLMDFAGELKKSKALPQPFQKPDEPEKNIRSQSYWSITTQANLLSIAYRPFFPGRHAILGFKLFIVDNASRADEYGKLEPLCHQEHVTVFRSRLNTGFSGANMMGVQLADADFYYFLNNDCVLIDDCILTLHTFLERTPDAGICSGEMFNARNEYEANFGYFPSLASKILGTGLLRMVDPKRFPKKGVTITTPLLVDLVNGSSMFVRASAFEEIGGMDTQYFLYCEEEDLALRLLQKGFRTYIVPGARYRHFVSQSTGRDNAINLTFQKEFYISFLYFYRKHYGGISCCLIQLMYFFRMIRKFYRSADYARLAFFILTGAPMRHSLRFRQKLLAP